MQDMNDREKIVDKIRKLKAHAESAETIGSEAEAQAFAAAMQRLMNEHTVTMTDIEFKEYERDEPVDEWNIDYSKYDDIKVKSSRIAWIERLASIVAKAYHCPDTRYVKIITYHLGRSFVGLRGRRVHDRYVTTSRREASA